MPGRERYAVDGGVAVVTGAAGGIGSAVADRLARGGSNLVLVDRDKEGLEDVDWLLSINLRGVLAVTSAFLPHLERGAHITNMSSLFGLIAPVGNATYSASKFGVRGFSLSLREELKPRGIGVTAVHPGGIRTGIARSARRGEALSEAEWEMGLEIFDKFLVIDPAVAADRHERERNSARLSGGHRDEAAPQRTHRVEWAGQRRHDVRRRRGHRGCAL